MTGTMAPDARGIRPSRRSARGAPARRLSVQSGLWCLRSRGGVERRVTGADMQPRWPWTLVSGVGARCRGHSHDDMPVYGVPKSFMIVSVQSM
jgi:hypothetical protein